MEHIFLKISEVTEMREANDLEKEWFALMVKADFEGKEIISEQLSTVFISS